MASELLTPRLALSDATFATDYNRIPFGFGHNLHKLDLFRDQPLRSLCQAYADHLEDYFVSRSATTPGTVFLLGAHHPAQAA